MNHIPEARPRRPSMQVSHDARFVVVDGRRTELSPAEASLLSCLIAHAGEPVSRARLHFALRSGSKTKDIPVRAVDFAIRRLRLKIEPKPSSPQMLFTVRGKGYRFVPPPETEARARTRGPDPEVAASLAHALDRPGGLIQLLGGPAPARGGLVRAVIDAIGGPPPGGVIWIPGRFNDPDDLVLAIAAACGPGMPLDQTIDEVLSARAPTIMVIDGLSGTNPELLARLRAWRSAAPQLTWVVMSTHTMPIESNGLHDLGPTADASEAARLIQGSSRAARHLLAQLLASPGAVDVDLLVERADDTVLDEIDRTGLVRISGRGRSRRATLITGATATIAASLSTYDQRQGAIRAHQLVSTLVPEYGPEQPWNLLLPDGETRTRAIRHHPLLMAVIEDAARSPRTRDLQVAVSALALMCGSLPRALMGQWLRSRGQRLLRLGHPLPRLQCMLHLALAWLEVPLVHPILIGDVRAPVDARRDGPGAADLDAGVRHVDEALRIAEFQGFDRIAATAQTLAARLTAADGLLGEARNLAHAARLQHQICQDVTGVAVASLTVAKIHGLTAQNHACSRWLSDAVPRLLTSGRPVWAAQAQVALGRMHLVAGEAVDARMHLDTALMHGRAVDDLRLIAVAADLLAEVESDAGREGEALLRRRESRRATLRLGDPRFGRLVGTDHYEPRASGG